MIRQFENVSSWRQHDVTIAPHEVYTLSFIDTKPNTFTFINPNEATLKIATRKIPLANKYEWKVEGNTTESYAQPVGTGQLYIMNDSSRTIDVMVFTVEKEFDPVILKNTNVAVSADNVSMGTEISGFAEGIVLDVNNPETATAIAKLMGASAVSGYTNLYSLLAQLQNIYSRADTTNTATTNSSTYLSNLISGAKVSGKTNLFDVVGKLNDVISAVGEVVTALGSEPTVTISDDVYLNNVIEFSYTAEKTETLCFPYIMNDGGATANITKNGTVILTMLENEYFCDMEIKLVAGDVITITSEQPMYRIKYNTKAV